MTVSWSGLPERLHKQPIRIIDHVVGVCTEALPAAFLEYSFCLGGSGGLQLALS